MVFMQPHMSKDLDPYQKPKLKQTMIQVNLNQMNAVGMVQWHKFIGEMVAHRLLQTTINVIKL